MNYICKQVKVLRLFKFRHHWCSAKELIDGWIGPNFNRWTQDLNWTHVWRSYDVPEVIWASYVYCRSGSTFETKQNQKFQKTLIITDLSTLWNFFKWTINTGERCSFRHLVYFILEIGIICKLSCSNNKLIFFHLKILFSSQLFYQKRDTNRYHKRR